MRVDTGVEQPGVDNDSEGREDDDVAAGWAEYEQFITTDNGPNMVAAIRELGLTRLPCLAHVLNLAAGAACSVKGVKDVLYKVRRVVTHFNHSHDHMDMLLKA